MSVREEIYNFLISETEFSAYVDPDSLGWISVDETADYPKVTYNTVSDPRMVYASDRWQRWRFYITSDDKFECEDIASVLTTLLNNSYGTFGTETIDYISKIDEFEVTLDNNLYQLAIDFRVKYH